jgi:hypothetical protein
MKNCNDLFKLSDDELKNLKILNIYNDEECYEDFENLLKKCINLEELKLEGDSYPDFDFPYFQKLKKLSINIYEMNTEFKKSLFIPEFPNLEFLYLGYECGISKISNLPNLKHLICKCPLENLPPFPKLEILELDIHDIYTNKLNTLPSLPNLIDLKSNIKLENLPLFPKLRFKHFKIP